MNSDFIPPSTALQLEISVVVCRIIIYINIGKIVFICSTGVIYISALTNTDEFVLENSNYNIHVLLYYLLISKGTYY